MEVAAQLEGKAALETHLPHLQMEVTERHLLRGRETMVEMLSAHLIIDQAVVAVRTLLEQQEPQAVMEVQEPHQIFLGHQQPMLAVVVVECGQVAAALLVREGRALVATVERIAPEQQPHKTQDLAGVAQALVRHTPEAQAAPVLSSSNTPFPVLQM